MLCSLSNSLHQFFMEIWKICMRILGLKGKFDSWEMGWKFNWFLTNQVHLWLLEISEILKEDWDPSQILSLRACSLVRRQNFPRTCTSEPIRRLPDPLRNSWIQYFNFVISEFRRKLYAFSIRLLKPFFLGVNFQVKSWRRNRLPWGFDGKGKKNNQNT